MSNIKPYLGPTIASDESAAMAIKALSEGVASPGQQQYALNYIIYELAEFNQMSYRPGPDGERDSAFAEGKRMVGHQIRLRIEANMSVLKQPKENVNVRSRRSK